jgi:TetR/AcrR family transcriptional regulator, transcriptional repressor for nem operon
MTKGEETRQTIVEKAAALLNQRGFSGFSMSALMEATGLEKGGIYRHFDSKEQLASEAFEYAWQAALGTRMRDLESISNSVEWLRQFIANFVRRRSPIPGGCPLFNTAVDADDGNPVLRQLALRALRGWRDDLIQAVKRGIERREIKREINPKELADIIISSLEGALMMSRLEGDKEALLAAQSFLDSYLDTQIRLQR